MAKPNPETKGYEKCPAKAKRKPKMTKEERRAKYTEIARKRRQKEQQRISGRYNGNKQTVCYHCRQPGHAVANCPTKEKTTEEVLCYKCGSTEHPLSSCPKRNSGNHDDLPYATCFLCKEKGHLVSTCPQNKKGIYVNGGSCRHCGSHQHLATDCPEKKKKSKPPVHEEGSDIEQYLEAPKPKKSESRKGKNEKKRRVVKF